MSAKSMGFTLAPAAALLFLLSSTAGCSGLFNGDTRGGIAERKVSPDRSLEAYVRGDDRINFSSLPRLGSLREHVWVHWGSPGSPLKTRKLLVAKAPADQNTPYPIASDVHVEWKVAPLPPELIKVIWSSVWTAPLKVSVIAKEIAPLVAAQKAYCA